MVAVCASLTVAAPAGAAPHTKRPTVCNLVTDRTGDAQAGAAAFVPAFLPPSTLGSDDALDITSADVASDTRMITGVIRVTKLSSASLNAPTGMTWRVGFTAGRFTFVLAGHSSATGSPAFDASYSTAERAGTYDAGATGVFDTARSEVRITVPRSLLAGQEDIKPGTILRVVTGETAEEIRVSAGKDGLGWSSGICQAG